MKKFLFISCLWSCAQAMQEPLSGSKRAEREEEITQTPKLQKIEDFGDETKQRASGLSITEKEIFLASLDVAENQHVASELKKYIEEFSAKGYTSGGTQRAKLINAANSIKNLLRSNQLLAPLIDDKQLAGALIQRLAQAYKVPLVAAAWALNTDAASQWIAQQYQKKEIWSELFYELVAAAHQGNKEVFDFFLKHAGNQDIVNRSFDGISYLRIAVERNDSNLVNRLLAEPNIVLNEIAEVPGTTSLMHAASHGFTKIVRKLIHAGAALDLQSPRGETALLLAVKTKNPESVRLLVKAHADPNLVDQEGNTPLIMAAKNNDIKALQFLIPVAQINRRDNKNFSALDYLVAHGNVDAARRLLNRGAVPFINDYDGDHNNPLITAVIKNDLAMVVELIIAGARFDVYDKQGNTPLMIAVQKNYHQIIKKLIQHGALSNKQDASLAIAAGKNNLELVDLLIKADANLNAQNRFGNTALLIAVERGYDSILEALLKAGADVNIKNSDGITALMIAAKKGNAAYLDRLLNAGARSELKDNSRETAYDKALKNGHSELLYKFPIQGSYL